MRKIIIVITIFLINIQLFAPSLTKDLQLIQQVAYKEYIKQIEIENHKYKVWLAIINKESGLDSNAINIYENAVGIAQLKKIYVNEVNLWSNKKYTYSDRWKVKASYEMFKVINDKFNPDYNIELAAHIHNAGAYNIKTKWNLTNDYRKDVIRIYKNLKNESI